MRAIPLVLLTTDAPVKGRSGAQALAVMRGRNRPVFEVIEMLNADDGDKLPKSGLTNGKRPAVTPVTALR